MTIKMEYVSIATVWEISFTDYVKFTSYKIE